ncbi:MAG: DNA mismatch repair endonuclease MutL [Waddliaceae bacterium]
MTTSSRIRILDDQTINTIAAGEVVENPASVVKELIENALDAGSKDLCIEVKGGGRQLIRVSDDGHGMSKDDAVLCLERHATSKIRRVDDIHSLTSMGFRGEAIPSIASISKLTLLTCPNKENEGTLVIVEGGRMNKCVEAARSQGTTVEVKSLFFNVPARKKFQRSPTYDTNEILKIATLQALAHPEIRFQLISDQTTLLQANCSQEKVFAKRLGDRISTVLGKDFSAGLCPIEREHKGIRLSGFLGLPASTRPNRTGQYLFVNRRPVSSLLISYSVKDGYGPALPSGRYPLFVLHLTIPGSLVDVNVHPQKREVRFRQERELRELMKISVEEALQLPPSPIPSFVLPESREFSIKPHFKPPDLTSPKGDWEYKETAAAQEAASLSEDPKLPFPKKAASPGTKVAVTLPGYLLLFSESGGLKLVDQRAAHSRILYETLLKREKGSNHIAVQHLLIPDTLDLTPPEAAKLKEHLDYFHALGFAIREFGQHSFIIHAVPQLWAEVNIQQFFRDSLHSIGEGRQEDTAANHREKEIAHVASRLAISQNKQLSLQEAQALVDQLHRCDSPYLCPHGKPTIVVMSKEEIDKRFQHKKYT